MNSMLYKTNSRQVVFLCKSVGLIEFFLCKSVSNTEILNIKIINNNYVYYYNSGT